MQKEITRYLRLLSAEKLKKNHRQCIELYNIIGGLYTEIGSYDEAFHYHEEAYKLCKTIGDRSLTTVTFRYMGEAQAALGNFYRAIDYIKRYVELAEKLNNKVEVQRAWTTLGRVYLMQAQELKDKNTIVDKHIKEVAREAEKRFQTALSLADSVRDQVDEKESAQMRSGLMINLGLVKDICGQHQEAVISFNRAIETCRAARIKEDLFRCQVILAGIYRQRNDIKHAVELSENALQTARSIGKKLLICDALIERGLVRLCQRDFKNAKRTFAQAYLEKSPNEEDHSKAVKLTKLSHLIVENYEKICRSETAGEQRLKSCDKLGDLFVAVGNYKLAIEFYRRAFSDAKVMQKPKVELARILYSIAETYADDGQFQQALLCYEKELSYRLGNTKEQCQSLIKIAHMNEYLKKGPEKVCDAYEKALHAAGDQPKLMHQVLKYYLPYMKQESFNGTRCRELEDISLNLKSYPEVINAIEEDDQEEAGEDLEDEVANVDDIITDDEDNDEVIMIGRRKASGSKFKQNEVGDTPLHEASIKGDLKRVKSLIAQGHDINPRDNAGWIPLHEACNHGHYEIAEYLIERGADVNNRGLKGVSPLHDAATNGHFDIMRLLMQNGANVIALTDTGETVLSCLRDYKKRNYRNFSNAETSEYKQMEAELLNTMDKCGFNLMSEQNHASVNTEHKKASLLPKTSETRFQVDFNKQCGSSVQDYRHAIRSLKRKNTNMDSGAPAKKSQPPTILGGHGSISTKQWLADDNFEESDDEIEDFVGPPSDSLTNRIRNTQASEPESIVIDDDELDAPLNSPEFAYSIKPSKTPSIVENSEKFSRPIPSEPTRLLMANKPFSVSIDDRKLLVPFTDESMTIRELKESIVNRFRILAKVKPTIKLTLKTQPDCHLFDDDLCRDVIKEQELEAEIESWNLGTTEKMYLDECLKNNNLDPLNYIKLELRILDESSAQAKLDWSHVRLPSSHIPPITAALSRRQFRSANFQGSTQIFECSIIAQDLFLKTCILTWRNLTCLNLRCTGMLRSHFEILCNSGNKTVGADLEELQHAKLPELVSLDISVNSIVYKFEKEFMDQLKQLLRLVCPRLKRIDLRKNHLSFAVQQINNLEIYSDSQYGTEYQPRTQERN